MIVIIAGSRTFKDYKMLCEIIKESGFVIDEIISGNAYGVDQMAEKYAKDNAIDLVIMPANWIKYGKSAGYIRNVKMAEYAKLKGKEGGLIAIRENNSAGTGHMIDIANKLKLKVFVRNI